MVQPLARKVKTCMYQLVSNLDVIILKVTGCISSTTLTDHEPEATQEAPRLRR